MADPRPVPTARRALFRVIVSRVPLLFVVLVFAACALLDGQRPRWRWLYGGLALLAACGTAYWVRCELFDAYFVEVDDSELVFHSIARAVFRRRIANLSSIETIQAPGGFPRDYLLCFRLTFSDGERVYLPSRLLSLGAITWLVEREAQGARTEPMNGRAPG
jgi:hypothetical protein